MLCRKIILACCSLLSSLIICAQVSSPKEVVLADKIIAVVGDRMILSSDIKNSVNDLIRQNIVVPNAACLITEQAIVSKLLMLQAMKDSLIVTDEEVESEIDRRLRPARQSGMELDNETADKLMKDLREQIKERMLAEAMQQKITENIKITPTEVTSFFNKIPKDSLPFLESEFEVGQIVFYPVASKDLEQYVIDELNNYKKQVENHSTSFCQLSKIADNKEACNEYEINRNSNNQLDPAFISAAFRLKNDEISAPVKGKHGFYLVQMIKRKGDDATIRFIFRAHPVTDVEINQARVDLNALRSTIMEGKISFNEAAMKYSTDSKVKLSGPFFLNQDGSSSITIDQLENDIAGAVSKMTAGEISRPIFFVDEQNRKGLRLIFLKSRSTPHIMNFRDDYIKISQAALEEKKNQALDKWLKSKTPSYYIMIDGETIAACPKLKEYESTK